MSVSPRSARSRSQRGVTCPVQQVEVLSGSKRIEQLSTPRFRITGTDWQANPEGFGNASPRMSRDQQTVFQSFQKMQKRIHEHPSGEEAQRQASVEQKKGLGVTFPPVPKLPTATNLFQKLEQTLSARRGRTRLCNTGEHEACGIAGLMLSESAFRDDTAAIAGTKLQKHELTNTEVPRSQTDSARFPIAVPTSGRRHTKSQRQQQQQQQQGSAAGDGELGGGGGGDEEAVVKLTAPAPSAVRSLAISGIDTSRADMVGDNKPVAPQYFHQEVRATRNGRCRYPDTMVLSQPRQDSGQHWGAAQQFDANTRGLHNASTYILEDKLRQKATDELRISKCGWNESAVVERAQKEIDFKKARNDKRVAVKRQTRLNYEERVGAGM